MPVLAEEPDVFPPDLFAPARPADGLLWWVAHTRPRQEKAVARALLTARLPYYLPCETKRTKVGSRVVPARIPLFSGYVFVRSTVADKWRILATNRVAQLLPVNDQTRLQADLERVRTVLDLGQPVSPERKLEPGTAVTLRDGPLTGMTGTVVRSAGGFKFVVRVDFIQQGVGVVVDGEWLGLVA
jgi:transcription antitermination factor NusG